jgi:hypothetical protein
MKELVKIMKKLFLTLLLLPAIAFGHGSSHIYHAYEHIDNENNTYIKCHARIISKTTAVQLHETYEEFHFFSPNEIIEYTITPTDIVSEETYNFYYNKFILNHEVCSRYSKYEF